MAVESGTLATYAYIALAVGTTATSIYAADAQADAANEAAQAEADARQRALDRKSTNERNALKENQLRRKEMRDRKLAELRVAQAASGFADNGTQLAVFGAFRNRLDDEIDQGTNQALDRLSSYLEQGKMTQWATDLQIGQNNFNASLDMWKSAAQGASEAFSIYRSSPRI